MPKKVEGSGKLGSALRDNPVQSEMNDEFMKKEAKKVGKAPTEMVALVDQLQGAFSLADRQTDQKKLGKHLGSKK